MNNILDVEFNNFEEVIKFNLYNNKTKTNDEIIIPLNQDKWTLTHYKYIIKKYNEIYNLNEKHKEYLHFKHKKYNPTIYLCVKYILEVLEDVDSKKNKIKKIKLNYLSKNIYKYISKLNKSNIKNNQGAFKLLDFNLIPNSNNQNQENIFYDQNNNLYKKINLLLKLEKNINKIKNERNKIKGNSNNKKENKKLLDEENKYYWLITNFDTQYTMRHKYRAKRDIKIYLDLSNNIGNRAFLKYYKSNGKNKCSNLYNHVDINKMNIYKTRNILLDNIFYDLDNNDYYIKINT